MSDFAGNEELLHDFLTEANELLADLDNRLVDLEKTPEEASLLNSVFRNFHTIKGGAGFLGATELVKLCHLTENLFDRLRNGQLALDPQLMDVILAATAEVRTMFDSLAALRQPAPAPADLMTALESALGCERVAIAATRAADSAAPQAGMTAVTTTGPDWEAMLASLACRPRPAPAAASQPAPAAAAVVEAPQSLPAAVPGVGAVASAEGQRAYPNYGRRRTDDPMVDGMRAGRRDSDKVVIAKDATIRIDTASLDQVLNLSGEIGLTKNRLTCLRADLMSGKFDSHTMRALDEAIGQLDLLVGDLQNAVMKTRMQPVGRLFQKYPRLVRDL